MKDELKFMGHELTADIERERELQIPAAYSDTVNN
jgi:hypothetical protein